MPFYRSSFFVLLLATTTSVAAAAADEENPPQHGPPSVARYKKALEQSQLNQTVNVEQLFELAVAAAREIEQEIIWRDSATGQPSPPTPSEMRVEGLLISTEEALFAKPSPQFFADLARRKGRPVDRTFFELLVKTRPDGIWPLYIEQQTDVTGCTRFENPELVSVYKGWVGFQKRFPEPYNAQVRTELRDLEDEILTSTCACGARAATIEGLKSLANAFPGTAIALGIEKRLQTIQAGKAQLRFNCLSG